MPILSFPYERAIVNLEWLYEILTEIRNNEVNDEAFEQWLKSMKELEKGGSKVSSLVKEVSAAYQLRKRENKLASDDEAEAEEIKILKQEWDNKLELLKDGIKDLKDGSREMKRKFWVIVLQILSLFLFYCAYMRWPSL